MSVGIASMMLSSSAVEGIVLEIDTTKGGSASDTFILATSDFSADDYNIAWGDGNDDDILQTGSPSHTYSVGGLYTVTITGDIGRIYFNNGGDRSKILAVSLLPMTDNIFDRSFYGCNNLVSVAGTINDSVSTTSRAFLQCNTLTSFSVDLPSSLINMDQMFNNCILTGWESNIPSGVTNMSQCFRSNNLTAWASSLPANCLSYSRAWEGNALDQTSVDFIIVDIESNGTSSGLIGLNAGTNATPSAIGQAATDALRARGWTVSLNGY